MESNKEKQSLLERLVVILERSTVHGVALNIY